MAAVEGDSPTLETSRRVGLLLRIGEIRRDRLDRLVEAASAYEAVLELDSKNAAAIGALELAYQRLGRDGELLRILERKAEITEEPGARAEDFARIADIREKRGDIDAALACYREAFLADPANRNTFTALERLCYKRERWQEAMELYDAAIGLVETGKSRAYRLGDLYARKGQIQLRTSGSSRRPPPRTSRSSSSIPTTTPRCASSRASIRRRPTGTS
jgi:tetratricopeptide (TPR) repeat protein